MSNRDYFLNKIKQIAGDEPKILVIHSSFSNLLPRKSFSPWDSIYALKELVSNGFTIALPSFTFSFCSNEFYDVKQSKSETGIFADWLHSLIPESKRTNHPIYSFVVLGNEQDEILNCANSTTFSDDSTFGLFEKLNAKILMLGSGWNSCTQIHRYEELAKVEYRYYKDFEGFANFGSEKEKISAKMFVRNLKLNPINDMSLIASELEKSSSFKSIELFNGIAISIDTKDLSDIVLRILNKNPFALIKNYANVRHMLNVHKERELNSIEKIAILGNSNLSLLEESFKKHLHEIIPERFFDFFHLPFGQLMSETFNEKSNLNIFKPNIRIFVNRLEDYNNNYDFDILKKHVEEYSKIILRLHEIHSGWSFVHKFYCSQNSNNYEYNQKLIKSIEMLNRILEKNLSKIDNLIWINIPNESIIYNTSILDKRLWYVGKIPFSENFSMILSKKWASYLLSIYGKSTRLIVVDLDNTLWGGVLGEDGIEGLSIGGDHPGNIYYDFQKELLKLNERGIAIAITSKNDEELALSAIEKLPFMILKEKYISAHRINWKPKWENIREIADELNLGLSSVLFIDDNPVEREQVKLNLPMVKVLDLPVEISGYIEALDKNPYLSTIRITSEDKNRIKSYQQIKKINLESSNHNNYKDYLKTLNIKVYLQTLINENSQRAVQLCSKTNQFNTTTKRYSLDDLNRINNSGDYVIVIGMEDDYLDFENIGLIIIKNEDLKSGYIDLFLLSCRVLGRDLETGIILWAMNMALEKGLNKLNARIVPTERNTPVRNIYKDLGFRNLDDNLWTIDLDEHIELPTHLEFINQLKITRSDYKNGKKQ